MATERFKEGQTIPYEVYFTDASGAGITTADGRINIRRKSDNLYFTGTVWQAAVTDIQMDEFDSSNSPGYWKFDFDTSLAVNNTVDNYVAIAFDLNAIAANTPDPRLDLVGDYLDEMETAINSILGLTHQNFVLEPTEFSDDNEMTKGNVRIYSTAASTTADDGSTNLVNSYTIDAPRVNGLLTKFTMILD